MSTGTLIAIYFLIWWITLLYFALGRAQPGENGDVVPV
jgi:predicted secreted protein